MIRVNLWQQIYVRPIQVIAPKFVAYAPPYKPSNNSQRWVLGLPPVRTKDFSADSHKEKVYKKGNLYISLDNKGHKGGFWKVFNSKQDRMGTYNRTLTESIGI